MEKANLFDVYNLLMMEDLRIVRWFLSQILQDYSWEKIWIHTFIRISNNTMPIQFFEGIK